MPVVWTIKENCKRCYTCIRECPAKAIKVESGQAKVLPERCIGCGHCVKVCTQGAKEILSGIDSTTLWLRSAREGKNVKVVALLAPSFPAAFSNIQPKILVGALKQIGFSSVLEVSYGAELINVLYKKAIEGRDPKHREKPLIATTCPAIVEYIEKYIPELIPKLAKIVSPMIATGKVAKKLWGKNCKTVFIGPCIAKKKERQRERYAEIIDEVLTFQELQNIFERENISWAKIQPADFDKPHPGLAKIYPLSGGLIRSAGLNYDLLSNSFIFTDGKKNVVRLLEYLKKGTIDAHLIDMLFCEGCINGPAIGNEINFFKKKQKIVEFAKNSSHELDQQMFNNFLKELDLTTYFYNQNKRIPDPSEKEINKILQKINKFSRNDELNCGACGYDTCREYAKALYKGLAEEEMCLPYLIEKLEQTYQDLQKSLNELKETQEQLIQSEKLASVGQLAAGVAHEVNNPLGSIILYAHLLMKNMKQDTQKAQDLKMIIEEATRCKNIVSGLLDFARQGKLNLKTIQIKKLVNSAIKKIKMNSRFEDIHIQVQIDPSDMVCTLDPDQMLQVLLNLLHNAADALENRNRDKKIVIKIYSNENYLYINIIDNGCGIPEENKNKLFTPFFTTKPSGKGTGLGLPIVYGIIKMHKGSITIDSEVNIGTKVKIKIPCHLMQKEEILL